MPSGESLIPLEQPIKPAVQNPEEDIDIDALFESVVTPEAKSEAAQEAKQIAEEKKMRRSMHERIAYVDEKIFKDIRQDPGESLKKIETIKTLEALSSGEQTERKRMGDGSVNAVLKMKFKKEDGGEVVGFMKQKSGEAYFDKDGTPLIFDVSEGVYHRHEDAEVDPDQRMLAKEWSSEAFIEEYAIKMAKLYRIPPEEFEAYKASLRQERFGPRIDIPPEGFIAREVAMSRMDLLCSFDVVPPTSAREIDRLISDEKGSRVVKDLASVQEGVSSTDEKRPSRYLYGQEFEAFQKTPPSEWSKVMGIESTSEPQESMARLATLDWLMGSQDRHFENMFIDPVSGKVTGIDNGLHSGRARGLDVQHGKNERVREGGVNVMRKSDPTKPARLLRSIPLEIAASNPDLKLSPRDQKHMKELYEGIVSGGPQHRVVWEIYKMMFNDEREAKIQLAQFAIRLKYVAEHGRPGITSDELYPIGLMTKDRFEKQQEKPN